MARREVFSQHSKPLHLIDELFSRKPQLELKNVTEDDTCGTFILHHQDHTLGNSLRSIIAQYDGVELCGYTNPHPLEPKIHLRIQTDPAREDLTPKIVLQRALHDLKDVTRVIQDKFTAAFDEFENEMTTD